MVFSVYGVAALCTYHREHRGREIDKAKLQKATVYKESRMRSKWGATIY